MAPAAVALALVAGPLTAALPASAASTQPAAVVGCGTPATAGMMHCMSMRHGGVRAAMSANYAPRGFGPYDLRSAYRVPGGGSGATVAIVDAQDDPRAEADLAVYRRQYGLPACTTANGCFAKTNQNGQTSPLPAPNAGWTGEISLDLDMVSAICPSCHILLVEANTAYTADMYRAEDYATATAKFVSNSWGTAESSTQTVDDAHFNRPGVAITVSTGDSGAGAQYPAASRYVTAVGGTSLRRSYSGRGWTETAWTGAGSGCSRYDTRATWQTVATNCTRRAEADVSAVADPNTGVAVYDTYQASGWYVYGGTSVAAPVVAAMYALAGRPGPGDYPAAYPYAHQGSLFDVTSGRNGTCGPPLCSAGRGWDGPTGLGTPNGVTAFKPGA